MKRGLIWAMILAMVMMGMSAYAMPVTVNDGVFTASAIDLANNSETTLEVDSFQLLGTDREGKLLIFAANRFLKIEAELLQSVLPDENVTLPSVADFRELARNNRGEDVKTFQNALIQLGYMRGTADGDYGGVSEQAVKNAQAALGLEQTGTASPMLQMLLISMTQNVVALKTNSAPANPFSAIEGKTSADLEKLAGLGLKLDYDDIDGVGMISNGAVIKYIVPTAAEIDNRTFEICFGLSVVQGADGMATIAPVAALTCSGVQRPIMQQLTLKSGDARVTLNVGELKNSLKGLTAVEDGTAKLDEAAVNMLANVEEAGELKIRITCKYNTYDITVPAWQLANIAKIGQAAQTLNP
ncbi:MAG: peptidoglycan-binding domain-containing protein [bacterium]